jgi:hypothetical protein
MVPNLNKELKRDPILCQFSTPPRSEVFAEAEPFVFMKEMSLELIIANKYLGENLV